MRVFSLPPGVLDRQGTPLPQEAKDEVSRPTLFGTGCRAVTEI
jgi:hypothetical protein